MPLRLFLLVLACFAAHATEMCLTVGTPPTLPPPPPSTNAPVVGTSTMFPVEVLGPDGSIETLTMPLASGAGSVTGLRLRVHSLTYEGKLSFRINGGAWNTPDNASVIWPSEVGMGNWGMGGIFYTVDFIVPLAGGGGVVNGNNSVEFRFNDLDGVTIGFRVLDANFVAGMTDLIAPGTIATVDPALWTPLINTPEAIEEGRVLWLTADIGEGTRTLSSKCTDCHFYDGRDLKYFNYSDRSIVERSIFHKLTRTQGEKIASYIRSLPVTYEPKGRPWNPPYQPGPGMDSQPARSWLAGAGLEAVVPTFLGMLDYIFPSGITTNAVDLSVNISVRNIPLFTQLPDWNHWLPRVHPKDVYPGQLVEYQSIYAVLRSGMAGKTSLQAASAINAQRSNWDKVGPVKPDRPDPELASAGVILDYLEDWQNFVSAFHWRVMKTAELMTEPTLNIQEQGVELFGAGSDDRRWFHGEVFRLGPHVTAAPTPGFGYKYRTFYSESMQWYQLQLVLNNSNRQGRSIVPIDWGYQHALNASANNNPNNMFLYGNLVLNVYFGLYATANEYGPHQPKQSGWQPYTANIFNLKPGNFDAAQHATVPIETRRAVAEALLLAWIKECEKWTRDNYVTGKFITNTSKEPFRDTLKSYATNFKSIGVSDPIINRLVDFAAVMFPTDDWSTYRP